MTIQNAAALLLEYGAGKRHFPAAKLRGAELSSQNLSSADLSAANLENAVLRKSNLRVANLNGACLRKAHLTGALLTQASLNDADLSEADLSGASLSGASLKNAKLFAANLSGADLTRADLAGADLRETRLPHADLSHARLAGADLRKADLRRAMLYGTHLAGARLDAAHLGETFLCGLALFPFCRSTLNHGGRSVVDYSSIVLSMHEPRLKGFLAQTGMPDIFVEYMVSCAQSLDPGQVFSLLQSTFISYGGPDEAFASKLNNALEKQGVRTYFFKDDAPPGAKLHRVMRSGVNDHDRVILVCSKSSLTRPGVLNELEETLQREARDGGRAYLIPVRLDDYVLDGWNPEHRDLAQAVRDRVIADFRKHEEPESFRAELAKLIGALKK